MWVCVGLRNIKYGLKKVCVYKVSRDYGVPRSTLHDRVSGKVVHGVNPGPKPYLSRGEEKELGSYLKHCAKVGYGKTISLYC